MAKSFLNLINIIGIFSLVYLIPIVISFMINGAILNGNTYQLEKSYIVNLKDLFIHFRQNLRIYINIFSNPIFWFFVSAYITQKTIKWATSGR